MKVLNTGNHAFVSIYWATSVNRTRVSSPIFFVPKYLSQNVRKTRVIQISYNYSYFWQTLKSDTGSSITHKQKFSFWKSVYWKSFWKYNLSSNSVPHPASKRIIEWRKKVFFDLSLRQHKNFFFGNRLLSSPTEFDASSNY